jgi:hypothetical protein
VRYAAPDFEGWPGSVGGFAMRFNGFVAMALACAVLSATAAAAEKDDSKAAKPASSELVCTYETPVGSHVKKRTCVTRAQRDQRAEQDRGRMRDVQNRGSRPSGDSQGR